MKTWLLRGLLTTAGLTFVVVLSAVIWGMLRLLGDATGAAVAQGVCIVAGIAWLGVIGLLVVLLAWDRLAHGDGPAPPPDSPA